MKVWIAKDKHPNPIAEWVSIFDKAPPIHFPKAPSVNVSWIASESGRCIALESYRELREFIVELGIDLQPGECREAEIEIRLIDAK